MKQFVILLLICALLAACSAPGMENPAGTTTVRLTENERTQPLQSSTEPQKQLQYEIYLPNENAEGFNTKTLNVGEITADSVLHELINHKVLPDGVAINNHEIDGTQLNLDFNRAFADLVCSTGTAGEMMIVGSVVNTYLSAFQIESVFFTVDGAILESGHVIYDFPIGPTE